MKRLSSKEFWEFSESLEYGEKVPRKIKKQILGYKLSKSKLRKRIAKLEVKINTWSNGYKVPFVEDEFCPNCGCEGFYSTGEMAEYPETWVRHYCLRCHTLVAEADNSALVHELALIAKREI